MPVDRVLGIALCGPFALSRGSQPINLRLAGKTLDLLRFLLINSTRPSRREHLADLFWGSNHPARHRSALTSALWRIRKALAPIAELDLLTQGDAVQLALGPGVEVDATRLTRAVEEAERTASDQQEVSARLVAALDACEGPFLDGASDDWALVEQERFFELRMRGLSLMMRRYGDIRRYQDALDFGRRMLAEDPFRESVHCEMMWLYVLSGHRARAIRQYNDCETLLRTELGISPMAELQTLRDLIRSDFGCTDATSAPMLADVSGLGPGSERLEVVFTAVERARLDVYRSLRNQLA